MLGSLVVTKVRNQYMGKNDLWYSIIGKYFVFWYSSSSCYIARPVRILWDEWKKSLARLFGDKLRLRTGTGTCAIILYLFFLNFRLLGLILAILKTISKFLCILILV